MNLMMRATTGMMLTALLGGCATGGQMASRGPSSDERMFATTFASCRDQVRAGKTDNFKVSPASPIARGTPAGDTGLRLKAPYDRVKSGKYRRGHNVAIEAATDRCLAANGYQVS
jgi:hypothetical protein